MKSREYDFEPEEELILLCLGANNYSPVKTKIQYQKILFLFSNFKPKYLELFEYEPYNFGPYSEPAESIIEDFMVMGFVNKTNSQFFLTEKGKEIVENIKKNTDSELLDILDSLKNLANNLSDKELMTFIYLTFPEYTKNSTIWDKLKLELPTLIQSLEKKNIFQKDEVEKILKNVEGTL